MQDSSKGLYLREGFGAVTLAGANADLFCKLYAGAWEII
jgi:hypothetical protein